MTNSRATSHKEFSCPAHDYVDVLTRHTTIGRSPDPRRQNLDGHEHGIRFLEGCGGRGDVYKRQLDGCGGLDVLVTLGAKKKKIKRERESPIAVSYTHLTLPTNREV